MSVPPSILGELNKSGKKLKKNWSSSHLGQNNWQGRPKRCTFDGPRIAKATGLLTGVKANNIIRAKSLQSKLDPNYPSFVKTSIEIPCQWWFLAGLPASFCSKHMPVEDTLMTLESHNRKQYKAKYLARKIGLSGGWKRCAISERLLVGDVLVFQLVLATKFKVFVIREGKLTEVDGPRNLSDLDNRSEQSVPDISMDNGRREYMVHQTLPGADVSSMQPPKFSERNITNDNLSGSGGIKTEEVVLDHIGMKSFEDFSILIDELLKNFELPRHVKWSYYILCCSQNALLHVNLLEGTNHILTAGVIVETVNITDALQNCQLSTFRDNSVIWDKVLTSIELLGMNVDFLGTRLRCLQRIALDPVVAECKQDYSKLRSENVHAANEIRHLQATLNEMKRVHEKRAADIVLRRVLLQVANSDQIKLRTMCLSFKSWSRPLGDTLPTRKVYA